MVKNKHLLFQRIYNILGINGIQFPYFTIGGYCDTVSIFHYWALVGYSFHISLLGAWLDFFQASDKA